MARSLEIVEAFFIPSPPSMNGLDGLAGLVGQSNPARLLSPGVGVLERELRVMSVIAHPQPANRLLAPVEDF